MSPWVTSTQSLRPIGFPISSRSSSIPETVTAAIGGMVRLQSGGPTNAARRGALSRRLLFALVAIISTFVVAGIAIGAGGSGKRDLTDTRSPSGLPDGFEPAILR